MTAADLGQRLPAPGTGDELDELGRAFNDLLDRLHEAFVRMHEAYDGQQRFAGDASHQLRTPLAALLGQVQVALRRDRSPEEYRRVLERVRTEGTRLRQIVESLLLLAQPEGIQPEPEVLDLRDWVADHLRRWANHPRAEDLRAEVADGVPLSVRVHPRLLAQLVDNLLENAFKYSAPGTPVLVRVWRENGQAALGVEDRGWGLTAEDLSRVFEPFFRGEQARRDGRAGVGLGLAVAQRIATTFGGTLDVRSQPRNGLPFRDLPPRSCQSRTQGRRGCDDRGRCRMTGVRPCGTRFDQALRLDHAVLIGPRLAVAGQMAKAPWWVPSAANVRRSPGPSTLRMSPHRRSRVPRRGRHNLYLEGHRLARWGSELATWSDFSRGGPGGLSSRTDSQFPHRPLQASWRRSMLGGGRMDRRRGPSSSAAGPWPGTARVGKTARLRKSRGSRCPDRG